MCTKERLLIGLLVLIMLIKGILWSQAFPLWQGPDEDDHYAVIQFIAELGHLPDEGHEMLPDEVTLSRVLADVGRLPYNPEQRQLFSQTAVGPNESAFAELPTPVRTSFDMENMGKLMHATPLYYLMASLPYRLFQDGDLLTRAQAQRLLSLLLSLPLVVLAYLISCYLFPHDAHMRLTIPFLVVFHPMITHITSVVSVDGFYFVCYSLLIYLSLRVFRYGFDWRYGLLIGVVFTVGVLTKPTLNGFAPLVALLVAYDWWRAPDRRWPVFKGAVVMGLTILPPVGWWMQRSYRLNDDLFYFNPVLKGHRILEHPFYEYGFFQHMIDYYQSIWGGLFTTWWAHFGWLDTALPPGIYTFLRLLTFLAIAGLLLRLWQLGRSGRLLSRWRAGMSRAGNQEGPSLQVWLFLALTIILPVVMLQYYDLTFWWNFGNGRGLQGRYWLGTVIPMLTFFVVGLLGWLPRRWQPAAHNGLRLAMVLLNVVSLLGYIMPRYYL
jgi:4-amino-4-deoxy-L-arabinose transferase-like glycosyltransferase